MLRRKRTEITVEQRQVIVLAGTSNEVEDWCPECTPALRMVSPEQAAILAGMTMRNLYRLIEAEQVHYRETPAGRLLVCLNSVIKTSSDLTRNHF